MFTQIPLNHINPYIRRIYTMDTERQDTTDFFVCYSNQLLFVRDGHGFLQSPAGYLSLRPGTFAIIYAGEQHNIISYPEEKLTILCFEFDCTQLYTKRKQSAQIVPAVQFDGKISYDSTRPKEFPFSKGCMCINNMQSLEPSLQMMYNIYSRKSSFSEPLLSGHFKVLLCEFFADLNPDRANIVLNPKQLIWEVYACLDLYYMEDISNKDIAARINYHPNYINKQIVKLTGQSLHQHLIAYRIARSMELLLFTTAPIGDIARSTGFKTVQYFSKVFHQNVGMPPSVVRELYKNSTEYAKQSFKAIAQAR